MPIFEYRCEECNYRFDAFFRRIDEAEQRNLHCPECSSSRVRKLFPVIGSRPDENRVSNRQCSPRRK
ncbi:MAG: hypothetical protein A2W01_02140 [Candidatus Solincola sediminis]|uniref:Putative regulatory protein FmdB zinc ribbon domain-containing protein n=1 Tax=Candidatus Solincola sediminis TaxID=1797199 RepID=A0A1F2WJ39_9ACTN|nr:MAG: hypothetical protein A2Y75_06665 [Candidatus Solincola sediminis]OFW57578.1 MAG: hypothetical protein A2W01_02140 [Candidatus Solincola sediminis]